MNVCFEPEVFRLRIAAMVFRTVNKKLINKSLVKSPWMAVRCIRCRRPGFMLSFSAEDGIFVECSNCWTLVKNIRVFFVQ